MPAIRNHPSRLPPTTLPEHEILFLPSDFTIQEHTKYKLEYLAQEEMCLREGEAHDALHALRSQIKYSIALLQHKNAKRNAIHGQDLNTRAGKLVQESNRKKRSHMQKYSASRAKMIALGLPTDNEQFPELKDGDTYMKDPSKPHKLGDGKKIEGWIWRVGITGDMTEEEREEYSEDGACRVTNCHVCAPLINTLS